VSLSTKAERKCELKHKSIEVEAVMLVFGRRRANTQSDSHTQRVNKDAR
jgi:hypothetical protein